MFTADCPDWAGKIRTWYRKDCQSLKVSLSSPPPSTASLTLPFPPLHQPVRGCVGHSGVWCRGCAGCPAEPCHLQGQRGVTEHSRISAQGGTYGGGHSVLHDRQGGHGGDAVHGVLHQGNGVCPALVDNVPGGLGTEQNRPANCVKQNSPQTTHIKQNS